MIRPFDRQLFGVSTLLILCLLVSRSEASWDNAFSSFYGQYNQGFQYILRNNCSVQYEAYLHSKRNFTLQTQQLRAFNISEWTNTHNVIECLLNNTPEIIKAKMAAAGVLLGLLPTILAMVGVQASDTAVLAVVGRKPFLTTLIACGSPATLTYRSSEYVNAIESVAGYSIPPSLSFLSPLVRSVAHTVVYLLACASIANIGLLAWATGGDIIFSVFPNNQYLVILWAFLGMTVHVLAAVTLQTRVRVVSEAHYASGNGSHVSATDGVYVGLKYLAGAPLRWLKNEFGSGSHAHFVIEVSPESLVFAVSSMCTAMLTACHIIFGTALFASALFISVKDSLPIAGRLLASAIMCRILVRVELMLMRNRMVREAVFQKHVTNDTNNAVLGKDVTL